MKYGDEIHRLPDYDQILNVQKECFIFHLTDNTFLL